MRKRICSFLLLCAVALTAWSQEMAHALVVELTDGTSAKFVLTDRPVISHSGNDVLIKSDYLSATYSIDAVKKYRFELQDVTAIETVGAEDRFTIVYTDGETVRISGVGDNATIKVYSLEGYEVSADVSDNDGQITVGLTNLPSGFYVVSVNSKQSFKVVRK